MISSIQQARIKKTSYRLGESFFTTYTKVREPPQSGILLLLKQRQDVITQLNFRGTATLQDGLMTTMKAIATGCMLLA
ncbi:hypothetical protein V9022_10110, partial [Streptococcus agalactiae]